MRLYNLMLTVAWVFYHVILGDVTTSLSLEP